MAYDRLRGKWDNLKTATRFVNTKVGKFIKLCKENMIQREQTVKEYRAAMKTSFTKFEAKIEQATNECDSDALREAAELKGEVQDLFLEVCDDLEAYEAAGFKQKLYFKKDHPDLQWRTTDPKALKSFNEVCALFALQNKKTLRAEEEMEAWSVSAESMYKAAQRVVTANNNKVFAWRARYDDTAKVCSQLVSSGPKGLKAVSKNTRQTAVEVGKIREALQRGMELDSSAVDRLK